MPNLETILLTGWVVKNAITKSLTLYYFRESLKRKYSGCKDKVQGYFYRDR